jgi:hypothetical protein
MSTIACEKTTNYILRPVLKTRPKKTFPYSLDAVDPNKDGKLMLNAYWTSKHHMMLDVVVNELLGGFEKRANNGKIFGSHFDDKVNAEAKNITVDDLRYFSKKHNFETDRDEFRDRLNRITPEIVALHEKDLIKKYDFLGKMTSTEIFTLLKEIASTRFFFNMRVKLLTDDEKTFTHYTFYPWLAEPLFRLTDYSLEQTNHNPPRVKLRKYMVSFEGILGRLFAHNVKALNVIRVPVEIYGLSQDAQFIYRRFVSTMVIRKGEKKSITYTVDNNDIERYLDMRVAHSTYRRNRIERALKEIEAGQFIELEKKQYRGMAYITWEMARLK